MFSSNSINSPSATDEADRRDSYRQCVDYSGLVIADSQAARGCRVLNISANGAQLKLDETQKLPDEFNLLIEDPAFEVACQIRHQCDDQYYGVMFMSNLRAALLMFGGTDEVSSQKLSN